MTRVRVEPRPFDQGCRKNDAFTHSATLPIEYDTRLHIEAFVAVPASSSGDVETSMEVTTNER